MKQSELKKAYDSLKVTPEMDVEVLKFVRAGKSRFRGGKAMRRGLAIAASLALVVGIFQIPQVGVAASTIIDKIMYQFSAGNESVDLAMEENNALRNVSKDRAKYDTLGDAQKDLGIDLLTSPAQCTVGGNHVSYDPLTNEDGDVYAVWLSDDIYALGDLENVEIETYNESDINNEVRYDCGDVYQSPIGMQIAIVVKSEDAKDGSVGFSNGEAWSASKEDGYVETEVYEIKAGAKAFITTYKADEGDGIGPEAWQCRDGQINEVTTAVFTYHGMEYTYYGAVSIDAMKTFLDTLE